VRIFNETPLPFVCTVGSVHPPDPTLTLIVRGVFSVSPGQPAEALEEQPYPAIDEPFDDAESDYSALRYESDFSPFKPNADLLLVGRCHTPGGRPARRCRVRFSVGASSSEIEVIGDRSARKRLFRTEVEDPLPFRTMELRYENAFGGLGCENNPVGKGYRPKPSNEPLALPNLRYRDEPSDPTDAGRMPAGFAPLGRGWATRNGKLGSYDEGWLQERWPWFPSDFDWSYFNAAHPALQVPGYLEGGESVFLENLHPEHPEFEFDLPEWRIRCFLNEAGIRFREVKMNLDTLWVDAEAGRIVLVWRGVDRIATEDFRELSEALIVREASSETEAPSATYEELLQRRLAELRAEVEFTPESPPKESPAEEDPIEKEMREADEHAVEQEKAQIALLESSGVDTSKIFEPLPPDEAAPEKEDPVEPLRRRENAPNADLAGCDLSGLDLSGLDLSAAILRGANLRGANLQDAQMDGADLSSAELTDANLRRASVAGAEFTAATLAGADLSEAQAAEAVFEKANLSDARLSQIDATGAYFSRADLSRADLRGAVLRGADLSETRVEGATFEAADLAGASLEGAKGVSVRFSKAKMVEARLGGGAELRECRFDEIQASESIWDQSDFSGSDLSYAILHGATFVESRLRGTGWYGADLRESNLSRADLEKAEMSEINLFMANLEGADLRQANLTGSNLYGAELWKAELEDTVFRGANLRMTKLADRETER